MESSKEYHSRDARRTLTPQKRKVKTLSSNSTTSLAPDQGPAPVQFRLGYISLLAALVGVIAGIVAFLLYNLIGLFTNLSFYHVWSFHFRSPAENQLGPWVIVIPVIGGIIVGFMAKYGSEKIKGHGIPEAMEAVLTSKSRIEAKVAILKPISAAIAIGTGGPFGAEGPIIQTGGAFGSLVGQMVSTTAAERKVLLACGAGAGMAATFNTPIAGVILAIELLLFEFRGRSFVPLVIATTLATSIRQLLLGTGSMFHVQPMDFGIPRALPYYLILGVLCGAAAIAFTKSLYFIEDAFDRLPISELWHPAIGALALGIIGFFVPRVLGVGYDTLGDILNNSLALKLLILVALCKAVALLLSLGSGTSGGLLAPMFMSSAAMGGVFAVAVNQIFPGAHLSPGACALVAMGAVFGAASRATFAFIVFAFEIVRDYNAVLPLMLVSVIAYAIALRYLPNSIMTEKLARRGLQTNQDYEMNALKQLKIAEVMVSDVATVDPAETVLAAADRFAHGDLKSSRHHALPIVDSTGRLQGIVTQGDLLRALQADPDGKMTVLDAGSRSLVVAYPDERVFDAVTKMLENNIGRLPVVDRKDPQKMVGYINRANVMGSWRGHLHEESVRELGWLRGFGPIPLAGGLKDVATGRVVSLTNGEIRLALNSDGANEANEFSLTEPARGVSLGDRVRVRYRNENGRKVAVKIEELSSRQ
jgi:CIC family chloride channel protein